MNETRNSTNAHVIETGGLKTFAAVVCIVILCVGVIGNTLVLIVFGSRFSRLKSFEIYLLSLAGADLLASFLVPNKMFYELVGGSFEQVGVFGCIIVQSICTGSIAISCFMLVVISLNRYVVVRWPLHERHGNFILLCVIVGTWVVGIALGFALYTIKGRVVMAPVGDDVVLCSMSFKSHDEFKWYGAILFISQCGLPLLSMSVLYGLIIYELKKTAKHNFFQGRQHVANCIYQRNRKSIRLLIALLVVFFICTTPEKLSYVIYTFEVKTMDPNKWHLTYILLTLLLMLNHCINPIVYAKLHTSFRRQTVRLFCGCRLWKWKNINKSIRSFVFRTKTHSFSPEERVKFNCNPGYSCGSYVTIIGFRRRTFSSSGSGEISRQKAATTSASFSCCETPNTVATISDAIKTKETFV